MAKRHFALVAFETDDPELPHEVWKTMTQVLPYMVDNVQIDMFEDRDLSHDEAGRQILYTGQRKPTPDINDVNFKKPTMNGQYES